MESPVIMASHDPKAMEQFKKVFKGRKLCVMEKFGHNDL